MITMASRHVKLVDLLLMFITFHTICNGENCESIEGTWYNELGSQMEIFHNQNGTLTGQYWTAVERNDGWLRRNATTLSGTAQFGNAANSVFSFNVLYNDGGSSCSWTGQCYMCDGVEVLETSWLLHARVDECGRLWAATYIGKNTFTRHEQPPVESGRRRKRNAEHNRLAEHTDITPDPSLSFQAGDQSAVNAREECSLDGDWFNQLGSSMTLKTYPDRTVSGVYRTAVESCEGAAGGPESPLYGVANNVQLNNSIAWHVVWSEGRSVTGWVAQCHVCNGQEVLYSQWLLRSTVGSCDDDWKSTRYGQDVFTRTRKSSHELSKRYAEGGDKADVQDSVRCGSTNAVTKASMDLTLAKFLSFCAFLGTMIF